MNLDTIVLTTQATPLSSDDLYTLQVPIPSLDRSLPWSGNSLPIRSSPANIATLPPIPRSPHVSHSTTRAQGNDVVYELGARVARSLETCKNRNLLANDGLWRRRTFASIETMPLVCCSNAKSTWFGDIGSFEKKRGLSTAGMVQLFVMRCTYLSLAANRRYLDNNMLRYYAGRVVESFAGEMPLTMNKP
jgi:hypothetical protein